MASFDALDTALAEYLSDYGTRVGVELLDVTRGVTYTYNADRPYLVASSMKVPIMLTLLTQLEAKGRGPNATELSRLTTMIENSNNTSASYLYKEIGYQAGINAFMKKVGITGLTPQNPVRRLGLEHDHARGHGLAAGAAARGQGPERDGSRPGASS